MCDVDIMMIGHFAKDLLVIDGPGRISSGGGVYYGSIALRRLGLRVAVVTRLHPDEFPRLDELKKEGVQVFATPASQTSGIANYYNPEDLDRRVCKPLGFAGAFQEEEVPSLEARIYAAVPIIAGEVDLPLLQLLARRGPVALDVQGFIRVRRGDDLVTESWPEMEEGLACVTYLKVDRAEAEFLTGQNDLATAARRLASYGPREVLVSESAGLTVFADGQIHQAPFRPRSLRGRTGRGDTCLATYLGTRLSAPPEEATRLAAAITTLKLEEPGPWRGSVDDAEALLPSLLANGGGC
jgi:sugar/nucleoside kinase (ribokinase family)